jgi:putative CocE/NonD family hydrolase
MLKVQPKSTASLLTRDGIRLDADIYRPDAEGEFPVLLMRQPYGRAIASTVVYAHPTWYAAQGYIVVIQDVRGRGTSEGEFHLFCHETTDGADTVSWAASLPGSTGKVGMYGFSYQAMTQLYAATTKPAALKTICPAMMAYDLYADWAYEGGAFCWQTNFGWAMQLSAETARLKGDTAAYQALYKASRSIPSHPEADLLVYLKKLAPAFYDQWLEHPHPDAYWENLSPKSAMQDVDLPMLHIGGWFDTYLRGNIRLYKDIAPRSAYRQQLLIGPWTHLPWCRQAGTVDFGSEAINPVDQLQVRWFDQFLKDIDTGLLEEAPVCLFEMGSNRWRNFASFPDPLHKMYFLSRFEMMMAF